MIISSCKMNFQTNMIFLLKDKEERKEIIEIIQEENCIFIFSETHIYSVTVINTIIIIHR